MKIKRITALLLTTVMLVSLSIPAFAAEKITSVTLTITYDTLYAGDDDSNIRVDIADDQKYSFSYMEPKNMGSNGWQEGDIPRIKIELSADNGYIFAGSAAVPSGVNVYGAEAVSASRADDNTTLYVTVELDEVEYNEDTWEEDDDDSSSGGGTPGTTPGVPNLSPGTGPVVNTTDGTWIKDATGWWYRNKDNSYTVYNWQLINSKWYFFDARGYMLASKWINWKNKWYYVGPDGDMWINRRTPDGYCVGTDGVWVEGK